MKDLTELANTLGTDKGTSVGNKHCYTSVYEKIFSPMRNKKIKLMEIGLSIGGPEQGFSASRKVLSIPSIEMWLSYFERAEIIGLDISDCSSFERDRFNFLQADCGDLVALKNAASNHKFDIIIDDGSHASFHQQLTMRAFFPALKPGGYYIIEDLDWQPSEYEQNLPPVVKTTDLLSWLVRKNAGESYGLFNEGIWIDIANQVSAIDFYKKNDLEDMVPQQYREKQGIIKRRRTARKRRYLGELGNPTKLAVIRKAL